jgi:hypothetical protein
MSSEAKMSMQTIEELQENFSTFTEHATALVSLLELYKTHIPQVVEEEH